MVEYTAVFCLLTCIYVGWNITPGWVWAYFIKSFYNPIAAAQPHEGYFALNRLNKEKFTNDSFHYITMNVDGYHQMAGADEDCVSEVHGTIKQFHCIKCQNPIIVPSPETTSSCPPRCEKCGGYPRPACVLFTEGLPSKDWNRAADVIDALQKNDVMIIVGTSSVVYPAASLPSYAKGRGAVLIEVNPDASTPLKNIVDIHLQGTALEILPQLVNAVLNK